MNFFRAALALAAALAVVSAPGDDAGFERYEVILSGMPFGAPPPTAGADGELQDGETGGETPEDEPGAGQPPVRLQAISRFDGVPAAGLVDTATGKALLLREGESIGAYRLVAVSPETSEALVACGTNLWTISMNYAAGQPTNFVVSANSAYLTAHRPVDPGRTVAAEEPENPPWPAVTADKPPPAARSAAEEARLRKEEDARLVREATIVDEHGEKRISYKLLNKLRAEQARKRDEEARAIAAAREAELRAAAERKAAEKKADEEFAELEKEEARKNRERVVEALAAGEAVDVDIELTEAEAKKLSEAGYEVGE